MRLFASDTEAEIAAAATSVKEAAASINEAVSALSDNSGELTDAAVKTLANVDDTLAAIRTFVGNADNAALAVRRAAIDVSTAAKTTNDLADLVMGLLVAAAIGWSLGTIGGAAYRALSPVLRSAVKAK